MKKIGIILLLIFCTVVFSKNFEVYTLEKAVKHQDWLTGTHTFEPGDLIFKTGNEYIAITLDKPFFKTRVLKKFPVDNQEVKNSIQFLKKVDFTGDINLDNQQVEAFIINQDPYRDYKAIAGGPWIGSVIVNEHNEILDSYIEKKLNFYFFPKTNKFAIIFKDYVYSIRYSLERSEQRLLKNALETYTEWEEKAVKEDVVINKIIKTIKFPYTSFSSDQDSYSSYGSTFSLIFESHISSIHNLKIVFDKIIDNNNEYIDHKPKNIWISKSEVENLVNILSEQNIKTYLQKALKKEKIEQGFN